jgi:glucose-6-phosphate 1-dehydrogenase
VYVALKRPPLAVFEDVRGARANHVRFRLSPDVVLELGARAKRPGESMTGEAVDLDACRDTVNAMPAYQRLLGDAMRGDQMLFGRNDQVVSAWRVVDPVLTPHKPVATYAPGSWGPEAADHFIEGGGWYDPI